MLTTAGLFRTTACPFYEEGRCERPNCHFKHVAPEFQSGSEGVSQQSGGWQPLRYQAPQPPARPTPVYIPTPKKRPQQGTAGIAPGSGRPREDHHASKGEAPKGRLKPAKPEPQQTAAADAGESEAAGGGADISASLFMVNKALIGLQETMKKHLQGTDKGHDVIAEISATLCEATKSLPIVSGAAVSGSGNNKTTSKKEPGNNDSSLTQQVPEEYNPLEQFPAHQAGGYNPTPIAELPGQKPADVSPAPPSGSGPSKLLDHASSAGVSHHKVSKKRKIQPAVLDFLSDESTRGAAKKSKKAKPTGSPGSGGVREASAKAAVEKMRQVLKAGSSVALPRSTSKAASKVVKPADLFGDDSESEPDHGLPDDVDSSLDDDGDSPSSVLPSFEAERSSPEESDRYLCLPNSSAAPPDHRVASSRFVAAPGAAARQGQTAAKMRLPTPHEQVQQRWLAAQKSREASTSAQSSKRPNVGCADPSVRKREALAVEAPSEVLDRPTIMPDGSSKVPANLRQRYLNLMIDEALRFKDDTIQAYELAMREEQGVYDKAHSRTAYLNACVMAIKRLRDSAQLKPPTAGFEPPLGHAPSSVSHRDILVGKAKSNVTFGAKGHPSAKGEITADKYYELLCPYLLTEAQLEENGYPRCDSDNPGGAKFFTDDAVKSLISDDALGRVCCRCGKSFVVTEDDEYICGGDFEDGECEYHWGKPWKRRIAGAIETRYNCCQSDLSVKGCCVAEKHVTESVRESELRSGWVSLPARDVTNPGAFAVDCEMVYTTAGPELARVSVLDLHGKMVYDRIVKPRGPVLDYNTRFSGLKKSDVDKAKRSLADIQYRLRKIFCEDTILIGHSLESDLKALKPEVRQLQLIHSTVVDTSVVFPHRLGPPYKRALKNLSAEILQKIIQDDVSGHDSLEDARSCLELMKWKIQEDRKNM